ncbi:MAG: anti-sigma F factor [Clostridiales bacterium]|jgi:stage II sporulation protein AB (anti-sigma F factor)|nr:anti-sigma F factor [Clostridiales bacterium]
MGIDNEMKVTFSAKSENESFARVCAAAFVTVLNPTVGDIEDVKTAVSEAVTNAVIHGYENTEGVVRMRCVLSGRELMIEIEDDGAGIENIALAMEPLYTSRPELERSGMGFTVMEAFMDGIEVESSPGHGTTVRMKKIFNT